MKYWKTSQQNNQNIVKYRSGKVMPVAAYNCECMGSKNQWLQNLPYEYMGKQWISVIIQQSIVEIWQLGPDRFQVKVYMLSKGWESWKFKKIKSDFHAVSR